MDSVELKYPVFDYLSEDNWRDLILNTPCENDSKYINYLNCIKSNQDKLHSELVEFYIPIFYKIYTEIKYTNNTIASKEIDIISITDFINYVNNNLLKTITKIKELPYVIDPELVACGVVKDSYIHYLLRMVLNDKEKAKEYLNLHKKEIRDSNIDSIIE